MTIADSTAEVNRQHTHLLFANHHSLCVSEMSFNVFRASFRNAAASPLRRAVNVNRTTFRTHFNRKYSTPPPSEAPKSSSTGLYIGLGAAASAGLAYYFYATTSGKEAATTVSSGIQVAKVKTHFVPSKEDYIKVEHYFIYIPCVQFTQTLIDIFRSTTVLLISSTMLVTMMVRVSNLTKSI